MQTFKALLFGKNMPVIGSDIEAFFKNDRLCFKNQELNINVREITVSVGGFNHDELFLNWQDTEENTFAIKPCTSDDIAFVLANAPSALKPQFNLWYKRRLSIHFVWTSLATLALICGLSAIVLWWQYDNVVGWVANQITVAQEEALGQSVLSQMEDKTFVKQGLAVGTVKIIGQKLTQNSLYHYQWLIKKDKTVNAFALPGGIIIVHSALIETLENSNELAAVLAHEVQHVEQRHALKNAIHSLSWAAALMIVLGDVNVATAVIAHQLGNLYFSRDKEEEADRLGFQALITAKIAPQGMLTLLEKLQKQPGENVPQWLSSHPDTALRIQNVQQLIEKNPCPSCQSLKFDWHTVQQDKLLKI